MTTPTLAELAEALDIVRRHRLALPVMPTLDALAETIAGNMADERIAEALHAAIEKHFGSHFVHSPRDLARVVRTAIESTGARITTDPGPGELVCYTLVEPTKNGEGWIAAGGGGWWPEDRELAHDEANGTSHRVGAVYLDDRQ